jgi:predicted dehydrogenase
MSAVPKVVVFGTGALGKEHARIYSELARTGVVELAGVHDVRSEAARAVADKVGTVVLPTLAAAIEACDAASVVTPTVTHHAVASQLLAAGKHVLVEKPMTDTAAAAADLVERAKVGKLVLQVGHVERFNPVFGFLTKAAPDPRFIECHRLSPYPDRSLDIGVVLDLMIHDLDVVLAFVKSPLTSVDAAGTPVLSATEDIANARLKFANGCVANLTASRVSPERLRKIRAFSGGAAPVYVSLDYRAQEGFVYRLARADEPESPLWRKLTAGSDTAVVGGFGGRRVVREPVPIEKGEPLRLELEHFVKCVRDRLTPKVSGEQGRAALDVALEITRQISSAAR